MHLPINPSIQHIQIQMQMHNRIPKLIPILPKNPLHLTHIIRPQIHIPTPDHLHPSLNNPLPLYLRLIAQPAVQKRVTSRAVVKGVAGIVPWNSGHEFLPAFPA